MTSMCILTFEVILNIDKDYADEFGEELAAFLKESWFNGEEVLEIKYKTSKEISSGELGD